MRTESTFQGTALAEPMNGFPAARMSADDIPGRLSHLWAQLLHVDVIAPDQNFFDLGGDSSLAVQMFTEIEKTFGVKLPLATLYEAPTIDELSRILSGEVASSGWSSLVAIQPNGTRPPFFCMHGAGGTVLMYRDLSRHLGEDQPFYGLQSPGLDGSCAPFTSIEEMAAVYVKEIRKKQSTGPYFIGGYCMGGTVAFEVAQQLRACGEQVALLALFDTMNWHKVPLNVWTRSSHALQRIYFHTASFFILDSSGKSRFLREKLEVVRNRLPVWKGAVLARFKHRNSNTTSDSMVLSQIWKANDHASWSYLPKQYPGVVADFRPKTQYRVFSKPDLKWDEFAQGGQEVIVLPVYPATVLVEPFVKHLALALRQSIDKAMQFSNSVLVGKSL